VKIAIESAEFHRAFLEHAVKIEAVVAAVVVMLPAAITAIVPDSFQLFHGRGFLTVDSFQEQRINLLTVAGFSTAGTL
jgi:hypothetical protein